MWATGYGRGAQATMGDGGRSVAGIEGARDQDELVDDWESRGPKRETPAGLNHTGVEIVAGQDVR